MSVSPESTVLIVDVLPLRNLGLRAVLDRLSGGRKFRVASLTPADAERRIETDESCSLIIYTVGSASVNDPKHLRQIKALRARAAEVPLVVLSDNDSREEIRTVLNTGAQGFLYAGTNAQLALKALSFILEGGSYFPSAIQPRHHRPARLHGAIESSSAPAERTFDEANGAVEGAVAPDSINNNLTGRQKAVLEHLSRGNSNKAIARFLGIREGTVKVHVRQIMRKLGVTNRTQVAIAHAKSAEGEMRAADRSVEGKMDLESGV
jgi:DNA-binding NarL/FixJ family response regulator